MEHKWVNLSIRGVKAATQLRLKALSIGTKQPIYCLVDAMVARAWSEIADGHVPEETDHRLSKAAQLFFKKMVR